MLMNKNIAFKILSVSEWTQFQYYKTFSGTQLDIKHGFIHMSSTKEQINRIKEKYYLNQQVHLLQIDLDKLQNVKFQETMSGEVYPHYYGKLKLEDIIDSQKNN
jgi:uncharacterized protein (DUF952 family)